MILWITGNSGAGKTTLAERLVSRNTIILDGNLLRQVWPGLG
ncbi:adenylyl-sulfate kinase, partial [candidate division TA06 bacterium]|nr:adenylyl-sulfate kinase [candidate division TA06 bacterium]